MPPIGLLAYRYATMALSPAIPLLLRQREKRGKEDRARLPERLGHASIPRPDGQLIWIHGASVGECLAALPLIETLLKTPGRNVLLTSGTVTSAKMMAQRLPPRAIHQFTPIDTPSSIKRFLQHWKPDAGLFVDSEIWPNMLSQARASGVPLALINGRMSERSYDGWRRAPRTARSILSLYDVALVIDRDTAARLQSLGARHVEVSGSLKADAPPLPFDPAKLEALRAGAGDRPILLAAQTHPGEDETILPAHDILKRKYPRLVTIIVPRHPERGAEIAMLCGTRAMLRRSQGRELEASTAVYIADTMGELGLFYRLAPFAFIGGSLIPHGGQNPLEPARLNCAVLAGPHIHNFTDAYAAIFAAQGLGLVHSSVEIADAADRLFANPAETRTLGEAAARGGAALGGAVEKTRIAVEDMLARHAHA